MVCKVLILHLFQEIYKDPWEKNTPYRNPWLKRESTIILRLSAPLNIIIIY